MGRDRPDTEPRVHAARRHRAAIGMEGDAQHHVAVNHRRPDRLSRASVPKARRSVETGGSDDFLVRTEGGPLYFGLVLEDRTHWFAGGRVPQAGRAVPARGQEPATVAAKGHGPDRRSVPKL